jgi:hypothetical protein
MLDLYDRLDEGAATHPAADRRRRRGDLALIQTEFLCMVVVAAPLADVDSAGSVPASA